MDTAMIIQSNATKFFAAKRKVGDRLSNESPKCGRVIELLEMTQLMGDHEVHQR